MINAVYDLLYALPTVLLIAAFGGKYLGMPESGLLPGLLSLVISIWLVSLRHIKKKYRFLSIGIVAIFILGFVLIIGKEKRHLLAENYFWTLYCLLFSALAIILALLIEKWEWVRRGTAILLLGINIIFMCLKYETAKSAVAISAFFLLICLLEEIQRRWIKTGYTDVKSHVALSAPVILVLSICIFLLPASDSPYGWNLVKSLYESVSVTFKQLSVSWSHGKEDYAHVGFSGSAGFFGRIGQKDQTIFKVTVDKESVKALYLMGSVCNDFSDLEWTYEADPEGRIRMMDTLETSAAVKTYEKDYPYEYLSMVNSHFENLYFNSKYAFTPTKTLVDPPLSDNKSWKEKEGSLYFDKTLKYGQKYSCKSYQLNYDHPSFTVLLSEAKPLSESDWNQNTRYEQVNGLEAYSYENYLAYRDSIYDTYAQAYGSGERVKELLALIRQNSSGKYEELKNIEALLKSYSYNTSPGDLPEYVTDSESYLDYFLFESGEGYCVHFATTFVLLARELGYPSRFVQGYYVTKKDKNTIVEVSQSNAHAWAEVYFDNVGWLAFEPTPGFMGQSGWKLANIAQQLQDRPVYDPSTFLKEEDIPVIIEEEAEEAKDNKEIAGQIIRVLAFPLAGVAVFILLYVFISGILAKRKYLRLSNKDKLALVMKDNLRLLKKLGYPLGAGETLNEYRIRLIKNIPSDVNFDFVTFYEESVYSNKEVLIEGVVAAEEANGVLKKLLWLRRLRRKSINDEG